MKQYHRTYCRYHPTIECIRDPLGTAHKYQCFEETMCVEVTYDVSRQYDFNHEDTEGNSEI